MHSRAISTTEVVNGQEVEYVEDWSIVLRSGTVKTSKEGKCGHIPVKVCGEKYGNFFRKVGKMKGSLNPKQNLCKQTMRNSSELAKSCRHLTANVENPMDRNLYIFQNSEILVKKFSLAH